MRFNFFAAVCCGLAVMGGLSDAKAAQKIATAPANSLPCQQASDCPDGICGSDGQCGLTNGAACTASVQCRTTCADDGLCGLPAARPCQSPNACRGTICNADGYCAYVMQSPCTTAGQCRSGICQAGTCSAFCNTDSSCSSGVTYCDVFASTLCVDVVANGAACTRDAMCATGVCGTGDLCGAAIGQSCTTPAACRSSACVGGSCVALCTQDTDCASGTFCEATQKRCLVHMAPKSACSRAAMCAGGVCASDHLCGALVGQRCTDPQVCRSGVCSQSNLCAADCAVDADCGNKYYCDAGTCTPHLGNGAACSRDAACAAGVCSAAGQCGQLLGGPCTDGNTCTNLACQPEDVRCGIIKDFPCTTSFECRTGVCNAEHICASCTQDSECSNGLCDRATGVCTIDSRYAGVGLEGGGCTQTNHTDFGLMGAGLGVGLSLRRRHRSRSRSRSRGLGLGGLRLAVLGILGVLWGRPAWASTQAAQGFALQRYAPTDPGQLTFWVDRPWYAQQRSRLAVGWVLDVDHNPLVSKVLLTGAAAQSAGLITSQLYGTLQIAGAWLNWLVLSVNVPILLLETGTTAYGISPASSGVGTIDVRGLARLFGQADKNAFSLHGGMAIKLPQSGHGHVHDAAFSVLPKLVIAGAPIPQVAYSASAGVWIRPNRSLSAATIEIGNTSGTELQVGAAVAYVDSAQHFTVGPELMLSTLLAGGHGGWQNTSSLEILVGATQSWDPHWSGGLAAGMGFLALPGTPDWRVIGRVTWTPWGEQDFPVTAAPPRDGDGIFDSREADPLNPPDGATHDAQNDAPKNDVTANQVGPSVNRRVGEPDAPAAETNDPVPETHDAAADPTSLTEVNAGDVLALPQSHRPAPAQNPADAQRAEPQAQRQRERQSPLQYKTAAVEVALNKHQLVLARPITFLRRSAALTVDAQHILEAVAATLLAHPEVKHITIEAHMDKDGHSRANRKLSQRRAETVRQFLRRHKVAASRLTAKGLGDAQPLVPNTTSVNRNKNMRVEFVLH